VPLFNLSPGVFEYLYNKPASTDVHIVFDALVNAKPLARLTLENAIALYPAWADLFSGADPSTVWSLTPPVSTFNAPEHNEVTFNEQGTYVLPDALVAAASTPAAITQLTPDKYLILPLPDAQRVYECRMFVALKPKKSATGMEEVVFDDLEECILHGALQHLLVLPGQAWSDRELAAYHAKQYVYQTAERRARANTGNMRAMLQVQMQPFGA
jgi:hypothetical protein